jgi:hypothetical protein
MRNLLHIDLNSYVIFIYPKENLNLRMEALSASKKMIENGCEKHLILFTWEERVEKISSLLLPKELVEYFKELRTNILRLTKSID